MVIRFRWLTFILCSALHLWFAANIAWAEVLPQRIAIAISGGASMGAYEAGLNWGVIKIAREAENHGQLPLGGTLRPLEMTGMAGTSAGGINTLLSALTWSVSPESQGGFANRIDDNVFRDVWLLPDVNRLLPAKADSPEYLPDDALLSRKAIVAASRDLRKKWRQPGTFHPGLRIPLGVTVTRIDPEVIDLGGIKVMNQRFYIPFEMQTLEDGSAAFAFDPNDYPLLRSPDFILWPFSSDGPPYKVSDQQVEDAILTTSAFPMGFGRKRLQYCRRTELSIDEKKGEKKEAATTGKNETEKGSLRCPDGYILAEAEFADGGLFDNLPIGLARRLSEYGKDRRRKTLPVTYFYLDPTRERFHTPTPEDESACASEDPPKACRTMSFDLSSEVEVLGGAMGTARKYELYRELTSEHWRLNLSSLSHQIADRMDTEGQAHSCPDELPFFDQTLACAEALRSTARLLELSYDYHYVPIAGPYSIEAMLAKRVALNCRPSSASPSLGIITECDLDSLQLRDQLAATLLKYSEKLGTQSDEAVSSVNKSRLSMDSDRIIHVTSRAAPITGRLLGDFGAFLDFKFREYDYYVGIYDAVMFITRNQCDLSFSEETQPDQYGACLDRTAKEMCLLLKVADDPKGRYVFGLLAEQEFGWKDLMQFAYTPMPDEDRDMRIIHDGLHKTQFAGYFRDDEIEAPLLVEREFFEHLKAEAFEPTVPPEGGSSMLALIMDDPEYWSYELVNRVTARIVYLEKEAKRVFEAREPDPEKQQKAKTTLMGTGALTLRTATYKYPQFSFAPSTAPESWIWRNIIPYEISFDIADSDLLILWQPTWNFDRNNLGIRFGFGFAGGVLNSRTVDDRQNYGTVGIDYTRLTRTTLFSGWGLTPAVYHSWDEPDTADQTTFGGDVHILFFKNRLRLSFGTRDIINDFGDTWFLTFGIADIPSFCYWLTR